MYTKIVMPNLAQRLSDEFNIPFNDATLIVQGTRDFFIEAIQAQHPIEIRGFGMVKYVTHQAYLGRNPFSGEAVNVPEKISPRFKPSPSTMIFPHG